MSEFTKDELIDLHHAIRFFWKNRASHDLPSDEANYSKSYELMQKLQSMIDNYPKCDHRSGLWHYNDKGERVEFETDIYRCRKCDILFRFIFNNGICVGHEDLE